MQSRYADLMMRSSELGSETGERCRELWRAYGADMQKFALDARGKAVELWQSYMQELQAAAAGDDPAEAAAAAAARLSEEYYRLDEQYKRACRERMQAFSTEMTSLGAEYSQKSIDTMIRYLEALREATGPSAPGGDQTEPGS